MTQRPMSRSEFERYLSSLLLDRITATEDSEAVARSIVSVMYTNRCVPHVPDDRGHPTAWRQ